MCENPKFITVQGKVIQLRCMKCETDLKWWEETFKTNRNVFISKTNKK